MAGFIRKREVILNARLVIKLYGIRVFLKCLTARKGTTFLTIVMMG